MAEEYPLWYIDHIRAPPPEAAPTAESATVVSLYPDFRRRAASVYGQDIVAKESDDGDASPNVIITDVPASTSSAYLATTAPGGPGSGVKSGVSGGGASPKAGMADTVQINGKPTVRHDTEFNMNQSGPGQPSNTTGKMVYKGSGPPSQAGEGHVVLDAVESVLGLLKKPFDTIFADAPETSFGTGFVKGAGQAGAEAALASPPAAELSQWQSRRDMAALLVCSTLGPESSLVSNICDHLSTEVELERYPIQASIMNAIRPNPARAKASIQGYAEFGAQLQDDPWGTLGDMLWGGVEERLRDGKKGEASGRVAFNVGALLYGPKGAGLLRRKPKRPAEGVTVRKPEVVVDDETRKAIHEAFERAQRGETEIIGGYEIIGTKRLVGGTLRRDVGLIIVAGGERPSGMAFIRVIREMENEAIAMGAKQLQIVGHNQTNAIWTPAHAMRLGFAFSRLDASTFVVTKSLP